MKKIIFILAAFALTLSSFAQAPDFSGKWKLNSAKSKLGDQFSMAPATVSIVQKGNDFSIEKVSDFGGQEFTLSEKYTLDGKECVNAGWQDSQRKSTAVWSADKKSLKITSKLSIGDGGDMTIIEVYKMDGANMIIESSSSSSFGDMAETMAYDKV
ncbi:MAG: hypothetical protein RBU28_07710 [Bacteroidales bacterium]|jgi:hypothetical protein|nr:hypothetical protein [Bacteroidales bacterium]